MSNFFKLLLLLWVFLAIFAPDFASHITVLFHVFWQNSVEKQTKVTEASQTHYYTINSKEVAQGCLPRNHISKTTSMSSTSIPANTPAATRTQFSTRRRFCRTRGTTDSDKKHRLTRTTRTTSYAQMSHKHVCGVFVDDWVLTKKQTTPHGKPRVFVLGVSGKQFKPGASTHKQ